MYSIFTIKNCTAYLWESQKHIVQECKILNEDSQKIEYEKIFNGTIQDKLKIARRFQEN